MKKLNKILVTGGAGYIGSIVTKKLIDRGYSVIVYDSLIKGYRDNIKTDFVKGCLSDKKLLDETFKKFNIEAVIHFAGFIEAGESMKYPSKFFNNNVINGLNLLNVMIENNVKKIIFSSSAAVYKPKDKPLKEEDLKEPVNVYGETKLMFERILKWYDIVHGIKFTALRYFNAFGTSDGLGEKHNPETHLIPLVVATALGKRERINIFGTDYGTPDRTCIRDYIDVKDLAEAHILALENLKNESQIYNVGTGKGISVREVISTIKNITKKDFKVIEEKRRAGDSAIIIADPGKIKKKLKWEPKYSFKQGLEETINYFKEIL